ncbi:MAG: hypothetical protein HY586_07720 [Candidatus Omnitrophica bacterium]|nr:hypothetical protein [Candidatus Omnitrophota bacterium]
MPTFKQDLEVLKKVQVLDKEVYDLGVLLSQLPERLAVLDRDLEEKKARYLQVEEEIKQLHLAVKEKELDLGKKDSEIKKLDGHLSQVKTNKEYSAILQEIANIKADKGIFEEKILTDWDRADRLHAQREEEKKKIDAEQSKTDQLKAAIQSEAKQAEEKIKQLKSERKQVLEPVSKEMKELYEKILAKREGIALAKIDGENCGGCQFLLRPQIISEAQLEENVTLCERCTRILYVEPK